MEISNELIKLLTRIEWIFPDPIYSVKSMVYLIDHIRNGRIKEDETVTFYHPGGLPLIFAHNEELSATVF